MGHQIAIIFAMRHLFGVVTGRTKPARQPVQHLVTYEAPIEAYRFRVHHGHLCLPVLVWRSNPNCAIITWSKQHLQNERHTMKNRKTWILVADGARARIVENNGSGKGLEPALGYDFAVNHSPARDKGTDRPGRDHGGGASRHAVESKVNWHNFEKHRFAGDMADFLEKADHDRVFDALVVVAPPEIMGALRKKMNSNVKGKVTAELGKDLTHLNLQDLGEHLKDIIRL